MNEQPIDLEQTMKSKKSIHKGSKGGDIKYRLTI
jgi:hypothetical protein